MTKQIAPLAAALLVATLLPATAAMKECSSDPDAPVSEKWDCVLPLWRYKTCKQKWQAAINHGDMTLRQFCGPTPRKANND
ncbi:MAG: hypothetical protein ACLP19_23505 [Xanthobacteraceae bacterium]